MAIHDSVPMTHEIRLNGARILKGDQTSVAVIYNNLSGRNFENPQPWRDGTHADYLAMMQRELGVTFDGATIELAEVGQPAAAAHQFH